ncbi:MAG: hypothetical protein ACI92W_000884 [Paraglaciecola sp.]|jgi:hypothetical protein
MDKKKDIQQQLEFEGNASNFDKESYDKVFEALSAAPEYEMPSNFATSIIAKIARQERRQKWIFLFWATAGVIILTSAALSTFFWLYGTESMAQIADLTIWSVFAGLVIVFIQYLDSKYVRPKKLTVI